MAHRWDIGVLYGPHGAPDFFLPADIREFFAATWSVSPQSNRTGVRLIGPKPRWARADGGEAEQPHAACLQEVCEVDVQRMLNQLGAPWVASQFIPTQPAKPIQTLSLSAHISSKDPIKSLYSPSHDAVLRRDGQRAQQEDQDEESHRATSSR